MKEVIKIDKKYSVEICNNGADISATRNGEHWGNWIGDNLVLAMALRIQVLEGQLKQLRDCDNCKHEDISVDGIPCRDCICEIEWEATE